MKTQFTLETWLKDKSQKLETKAGEKVEIVKTDCKSRHGSHPILAIVHSEYDIAREYTEDGYWNGGPEGNLFIVTPEHERDDEKIRRQLIVILNNLGNGIMPIPENIEEIYNWLERQKRDSGALETLVSARDALKALTESGYIPFASPCPCSNEVNIRITLRRAIENLEAAIKHHENQFGKIK